ncbi:MAG TPA: c-type cytochrome [Candidatus Acidoferrum sp.]|nr:c-type cytochrome [Candidatus Acidoferrum sp.]
MKAIRMISVGLAIAVANGQLAAQQPLPKASSKTRQIARGKYLVERAVPCADCHSARNKQGELMLEKPLQGAPILFKPTVPIPGWADRAPNIAGLPGWTDEQAIKFLMTGIAYNDLPASPPMPPFRFNREDAIAIVAYLRTLKPAANARQVEQPRFDH